MRGFAPNSIDCECAYYRDGLDSMRGFGFASNTIDYECAYYRNGCDSMRGSR